MMDAQRIFYMVCTVRRCSQGMLNGSLKMAERGMKNICANVMKRSFAVLTSRTALDKLDLSSSKVQRLISFDKINPLKISVPLEAPWEAPGKIILKTTPKDVKIPDITPVHFFFGGLPALMAAAKKKGEYPKSQITYVTNGKISKSTQSGHQAHNHPSEFVAEDCNKRNLIKTVARGMNIVSSPDPTDLKRYSYLHFPNLWAGFLQDPIEQLKLYAGFFKQRILHDITSKNGVSTQDRWLCRVIENSLNFHEKLSKKIEAKTGLKTLKRDFRIYWSHDHEGIAKKATTWRELGINCETMHEKEIIMRTLLRTDKHLAVLKIHGDGQFEPETPKRIADYFSNEYRDTFKIVEAEVKEIYLNPDSQKPEAVKFIELNGDEKTIPVNNVFGSPGHDQVYKYDAVLGAEKQLWKSVPVSGVSSLWLCTIPQKELEKRWNLPEGSEDLLKKHLTKLCASANLCNLHVTIFENEIREDNVQLYVRVSQGANFNSTVADNNDLTNMATNLDQFFIGNWGLISAGTCTRQTNVTNVPTIADIHSVTFGRDYSGVGYSASVPPDPEDPKPSVFG